ncbi:nucleotidyltransferase domain-containing protein [Kosakonia cowanii]|uniref:nucleotidyltransferase domain-containing protein n=1 Tax=Kosakonia cowanii TaxID=208223 RepID=UPI0028B19B18|nr:nucleotidyltransferase domain-containing protein [Kosakonia cowanii]
MVDADGFITCLPDTPLQPAFRPVVDEVIGLLHARFDALVHSIYLYGSVAKGAAVAGVSDLDVCLITRRVLNAAEHDGLREIAARAQALHPVISKVDFDCGTLAEALAPENQFSWGYWLKHHCRCVAGEDLASRFSRFTPSREIAVAVNGDFIPVLQGYLQQLAEASDARLLQRAAARKLLRATNLLRRAEDNDWPETLEEYASRVIQRFPQQQQAIGWLLQQCHTPEDDTAHFTAKTNALMRWLEESRR